ncbi:MAG: hypothetical protein QW572_07605 [Candidatus Nitrosocaldus sp.]
MYAFAFNLWDIGLWLAVSSIILLITSELLAPYYGRMKMVMDVKRLRIVAVGSGLAFLVIAAIRISAIIG